MNSGIIQLVFIVVMLVYPVYMMVNMLKSMNLHRKKMKFHDNMKNELEILKREIAENDVTESINFMMEYHHITLNLFTPGDEKSNLIMLKKMYSELKHKYKDYLPSVQREIRDKKLKTLNV